MTPGRLNCLLSASSPSIRPRAEASKGMRARAKTCTGPCPAHFPGAPSGFRRTGSRTWEAARHLDSSCQRPAPVLPGGRVWRRITQVILIIAAILLAAAFSLQRLNFWRREGLKLQQSGYLPPKSGWIADRVFQGLTRLLIFLTVGPVKVIGRQNAS